MAIGRFIKDLISREINIDNTQPTVQPSPTPLFVKNTPAVGPTVQPRLASNQAYNVSPKQLNRVVAAVIAEAGGEGSKGLQAVLNSAVNRIKVNPKYYGANLWEVISKPYQYTGFSVDDPNYKEVKEFLDGKSKKLAPGRKEQIELVQNLIELAKMGKLDDLTSGATHYLNPAKATDFSWVPKAQKKGRVGNHDFYYLKQ